MSEQRIRREVDALDDERAPWWAWNLPDDGPSWTPFAESDAAYGVKSAATGQPLGPGTVGARLEAEHLRKRRMTWHALLCLAAVVALAATLLFKFEPLLASDAAFGALAGGAGAALLLAPSFARGFARAEKRLTLYRLLAAHYGNA